MADESVDKEIVDRLRADGHNVLYIAEENAGIDDRTVLDRSLQTGAVLLTADKDFGDLIFRQRLSRAGVLLVRLAGVGPDIKAGLVASTFEWGRTQIGIRRAFQTQSPIPQVDIVE